MPSISSPQSIDQIAGPGAGQAVPAGDYNSLFAGLLELQWKGIGFPFVHMRNRLRHDLALHKFADRDGAHVEGMGRHPMEFSARVPLINGLDQGVNEHWQRPLYPYVRDKLLQVCADRSSGVLQHPELGNFTCKLVTFEWELEAQVRAGVWADLTWIETDDTGDSLQQALSAPSPLSNAQVAANDMDLNLSAISPIVTPSLPTIPYTFTSLIQGIRGTVDQVTELSKSTAGRLDNVIYECNTVTNSLNMAVNASPLNWPLLRSAQQAKEAAYDLKASILQKGRTVSFYTTAAAMTFSQIATAVGANVMDLISLNPAYAVLALVPMGASVRYYKS